MRSYRFPCTVFCLTFFFAYANATDATFWCALTTNHLSEEIKPYGYQFLTPPNSFQVEIKEQSFYDGNRIVKMVIQPGELLEHIGKNPHIVLEANSYSSDADKSEMRARVNEQTDPYSQFIANNNDGSIYLFLEKSYNVQSFGVYSCYKM